MANDMAPNEDNFEAARQAVAKQFGQAAPDSDADIHDETHAEFEAKVAEHGLEGVLNGDDDDLTEEEMQAAREREDKRRAEANDAGFEDEKAQKERKEKFNDAAKKGAEDEHSPQYMGSHTKDFLVYGIKDKGSFMKYNGEKVSDKQLRRMILRGHLEKGWKTMYFYDKKGNIDQQLTSRANNIIASFGASKDPRLVQIAKSLSISSSTMTSVEPFRAGNPLAHVAKAMENMGRTWDSKKQGWKNTGAPIPGSKGISSLIS